VTCSKTDKDTFTSSHFVRMDEVLDLLNLRFFKLVI
jgi:hypothetical protein